MRDMKVLVSLFWAQFDKIPAAHLAEDIDRKKMNRNWTSVLHLLWGSRRSLLITSPCWLSTVPVSMWASWLIWDWIQFSFAVLFGFMRGIAVLDTFHTEKPLKCSKSTWHRAPAVFLWLCLIVFCHVRSYALTDGTVCGATVRHWWQHNQTTIQREKTSRIGLFLPVPFPSVCLCFVLSSSLFLCVCTERLWFTSPFYHLAFLHICHHSRSNAPG